MAAAAAAAAAVDAVAAAMGAASVAAAAAPAAAVAPAAAAAAAVPAAAARGLRIGTLNVHGFCDAGGGYSMDRLVELVKAADVDVLGLQEVHSDYCRRGPRRKALEALAEDSGMRYVAECIPTFLGNAIISRLPLANVRTVVMRHTADHLRCALTADITAPDGSAVRFATLHLNHMKEPTRLEQWRDALPTVLRDDDRRVPSVLVGDFNALCRADYTAAEWERVTTVRERGRWESPRTELTAAVAAAGYTDLYHAAKGAKLFKGDLSTCAYDTRIDYVWASPSFAATWRVARYEHIATTATDHSLVVADLVRRAP